MTTDREIERLLDTWFADGPTQVADRVIDGMAGRIGRQPQRPAWRLRTWRLSTMSTPARLAFVAAALGLALLAGGILLAGASTSNPPEQSTPAASLSSSGTGAPLPDAGPIDAGTYVFRPAGAGDPMFVVDLAADWQATGGHAIEWNDSVGANDPGGIAMLFGLDPLVSVDPCRAPESGPTDGPQPSGPQIDDIVTGLSRLSGASVSNVTDVVVDRYSGKRLDLQLPAAPGCDYRPFAGRSSVHAQGPSNRWRLWLLDVDRTTALIGIMDYADTPADHRAAAEAVVESMRVAPHVPTMANGAMDAGTYVAYPESNALSWAFTVPAGWSGVRDWGLYPTSLGLAGGASSGPDGVGVAFVAGPRVVLDPCDRGGSLSQAGSAADLVGAIQAKDDWVVSEPVDVTVDGQAAKRLDVALPADVSRCADGYAVFRRPGTESGFSAQGPSNRLRLWIFEAGGEPVVLVRESFAATPADRLAEADRIIESSVFGS